jgi:diaminopimelate decarboxylase
LVGAHGVLVASVVGRKHGEGEHRWLMIDAGMNDLMRPALYQARHRIVPVVLDPPPSSTTSAYHVVGPVCESSDDFGVHDLPDDTAQSSLREVAILDAGAYGYSMASRYNGRALAAEVFLSGGKVTGATPRSAPDEWVQDRLRAGAGLV